MNREGMPKYLAAEMCYTINDHWGIGNMDFNYKSPAELIRALCDCRKVGANLLLNIGPSAQGGILPMQEEYLKAIGIWNSVFGEAIYNGKPYSVCNDGKDFILKGEDNTLYAFVYNLGRRGSEHVVANGVGGINREFVLCGDTVKEACWMDSGEVLSFSQNGNTLTLSCTGYPYGTNYCVRVAKIKI